MALRLGRLWWGIGELLIVIVTVFSLVPPSGEEPLLPDKLVHFTAYLVLGAWFVALLPQRRWVAFAGVLLLGGTIEVLQGLTGYRQAEWFDLLANTLGAALALLLVRALPANPFQWFETRVLKVSP